MSAAEAERLFGGTMRTRNRNLRDLLVDEDQLQRYGLERDFSESVGRLVLATKHHDGSLHADASLLVDIDLSILGQPPERFWEYEGQIRKEYQWVPENAFAAKRADILQQFLSREKIYTTEYFLKKYERQARMNLSESVQKLRRG